MTPSEEVKAALELALRDFQDVTDSYDVGDEDGDKRDRAIRTLRAYLRVYDQREAVVQAALRFVHEANRPMDEGPLYVDEAANDLMECCKALLEAEAEG